MFPVSQMLIGDKAFYNQKDYHANLDKELKSKKPLPVLYHYETESKIQRLVNKIFSILCFPIFIYQKIHSSLGYIVVPATGAKENHTESLQRLISKVHEVKQKEEWLQKIDSKIDGLDQATIKAVLKNLPRWKRFSVEVDGKKVDTYMYGTEETFQAGNWILTSQGNVDFAEREVNNSTTRTLAKKLHCNILSFNYPQVGLSSGPPSREAMVKTYKAMLKFLEDREKGIGAKRIYLVAHSIGGGVQAAGLKNHKLKEGTEYLSIKSRTFSSISNAILGLTGIRILSALAHFFGWNFLTTEDSAKSKIPEIILQTADVVQPTLLQRKDQGKIIDDGVIKAHASHGKAYLEMGIDNPKKCVIGVPEDHNSPLSNMDLIVQKAQEFLAVPSAQQDASD